jgi:hypothetical protein
MRWVVLLLVCAGCKSPLQSHGSVTEIPSPAASVSVHPTADAAQPVTPSARAPVSAPFADATGQGDLDGDGRAEAFSLSRAGLLRVDNTQATVELQAEIDSDEWRNLLPSLLRIVDLEPRDGLHELLVTHRASGSEDPRRVFELFRYQAGELIHLGQLQTGPGRDLTFAGNGRVLREEDAGEVCRRASEAGTVKPGRKFPRHELEYQLNSADAELVASAERALDTVDCYELAQ